MLVKTPPHGNIDLTRFEPNELVVAYAMTHVYSPKEQTVLLFIGTDDGGKVLLNDKEVFRKLVIRGAGADQDTVVLHLSQGWNKLVMKIENNYGGFGFFARVRVDNETLLFDPLKRK